MKNKLLIFFAVFLLLFANLQLISVSAAPLSNMQEVRGLWIPWNDFEELGLTNASKYKFRYIIARVLDRAIEVYGCNTIFWHARAFDDAAWRSRVFKASKYLAPTAPRGVPAAEVYDYDPTQIVIDLCRERGQTGSLASAPAAIPPKISALVPISNLGSRQTAK